MGFNLKEWAKKNLTVPKEFKKINIGHTIRDAAIDAVKRFEQGVKSAGERAGSIGGAIGSLPETVENVNQTATTARTLMFVAAGAAVLFAVYMMRKR